jgi:hypothetical protein
LSSSTEDIEDKNKQTKKFAFSASLTNSEGKTIPNFLVSLLKKFNN